MLFEKLLSRKRTELANKIIPLKYRDGRILDIGCGEQPYFLINTKFRERYGIDRIVNKEVFDRNKEGDIVIKECDIEKEGLKIFDDQYFDVVTMLAVFEHLEPALLPYIIKEIRRVLKPDGILILTTPAQWTDFILHVLSGLRLINSTLFKEHKDVYNAKKISSVLTRSGFSEDSIKLGNFELFMNIWALAQKT